MALLAAILALFGIPAACSLGNLSPDTCAHSGECTPVFGAGSECVEGYCTDPVRCDGDSACERGTCRGGYCSLGQCEGTVNGKACFGCVPETRQEFLNACTNATCVAFDPTRLTKMTPDGQLPPLPP